MSSPGATPEEPDPIDVAMALVRQHGGRASEARRVVLEALIDADGAHRSAEQIVDWVHARHPEMHESTVYRTLERFEELGLVYHVHLGHGPSQWLLAGHRRLYLACTRCGEVIGADASALDAVKDRLLQQFGFSVDYSHFAITGVCSACRAGAPH